MKVKAGPSQLCHAIPWIQGKVSMTEGCWCPLYGVPHNQIRPYLHDLGFLLQKSHALQGRIRPLRGSKRPSITWPEPYISPSHVEPFPKHDLVNIKAQGHVSRPLMPGIRLWDFMGFRQIDRYPWKIVLWIRDISWGIIKSCQFRWNPS